MTNTEQTLDFSADGEPVCLANQVCQNSRTRECQRPSVYCFQFWLEFCCCTACKNVLSHVTTFTNACVCLCNIIL